MFYRRDNHRALAAKGQKDFSSIAREIGRMWKAISPEERARYDQMAAEDALRYRQEKQERDALIMAESTVESAGTHEPGARPKRAKAMPSYAELAEGQPLLEHSDEEPELPRAPEGSRSRRRGGTSIWSDGEIRTYLDVLKQLGTKDLKAVEQALGGSKTLAQIKSWFGNNTKRYNLNIYVGGGPNQPSAAPMRVPPSTVRSEYCSFCLVMGSGQDLLVCAKCDNAGHQSCLKMPERVWNSCKAPGAQWTCIECKVCAACHSPGNDDALLFCDHCDAGYHYFCVTPPLDGIPEGEWVCASCAPPAAAASAAAPPAGPRIPSQSPVVAGTPAGLPLMGNRGAAPPPSGPAGLPVMSQPQPAREREYAGSPDLSLKPAGASADAEGQATTSEEDEGESPLQAAGKLYPNEETNGAHAVVAGLYYNVLLQKYMPR